jgi:Tfp pilus assembly protein PilF
MRSRVLALSLLLALTASAQRNPGNRGGTSGGASNPFPSVSNSRGNETLSVRITNEQDRPLTIEVRVQLTNNAGVPVSENFAHDGMTQFPIQPGTYRLRVSGPDIEETTSDSFTVFGGEGAPMQFVRVKMRPQPGQGGSTQGTVSASELNVPDKAKSEVRKAHDEMAHQQWKKAVTHLEKAIEIYPQYATAYNDLGVAYIKTGDSARARQSFEKAAEFNEHTGMAYLNLARFSLSEQNYPETIRLVNRALSLNPNHPEALLMLANSELATGQYASALVHARKVHDLNHERFAVTHVIAARALEAEQKPAQAVAEYEMFLKEDPNSPRAAAVRDALKRVAAQAQPAPAVAATPKP